MSNEPTTDTTNDTTNRTAPSDGEEFIDAQPDRAPTPAESSAADRAAQDVDVDEVGKHYEEMIERGANVAGEGQIDPT
ncbi:MAG: hypothetical protein JWL72_4086 [Ilumatobacteraceae bacterium]|nr:hypothetical protein [Ilumatobacteraceae bacterium]MCU1390748.1 hypothetical protein [Ilumatobacteraceae bacterium]